MTPKQTSIVVAFGGYVLLIVCFAVLYHVLYRRRTTRFLFAVDIVRSKAQEVRLRATNDAVLADSVLGTAPEVLTALQSETVTPAKSSRADAHPDDREFAFQSGLLVRSNVWRVIIGDSGSLVDIHLDIERGSERVTLKGSCEFAPTTAESLSEFLRAIVAESVRLRSSAQRRLSNSSDDPPRVWNFVDFLYFSTVTQSTVGYGDILPNSSLIRMLVASQILLGYVILVVVLNFALVE
jgi:hypothetical protein